MILGQSRVVNLTFNRFGMGKEKNLHFPKLSIEVGKFVMTVFLFSKPIG